jgi:hypothetical protein
MSNDLEARIAAALTDSVTSETLDGLVTETEQGIADAQAAAEAEREKALDLTASPDAKAAREAVAEAEFVRDRLRAALPRLQERLQKVEDAEYLAGWLARYEVLKEKRDGLARELPDVYPPSVAKIPDLFSRITANDLELDQLHQARPSGVSLHLDGAELTARGLDRFTRDEPSIITELRLPGWPHSGRMAWPPPQPFDPERFAPAPHDRRFSSEWWVVQQEEAAALREREEREAAEREAEIRARPGLKWWDGERA